MGVIYKLNEEVVNFIIEKKKENSNISCRKLVGIINEKFQINVSKSSINAIIKTVNLSSPVGRRSNVGKTAPKFKIPPERKAQIFSMPFSPEISTRTEDPSVYCKGAGCFFLKAAEWEICGSSILGNLLSDYSNIHEISDILMYLKIFGEDNAENVNDWDSLKSWRLKSSGQKISQHEIVNFFNNVGREKDFSSRLSELSSRLFSEIKHLTIFFSGGESLHVDPRLNSLWADDRIPSAFSLPLYKASAALSSNFIANLQPIVIQSIPGKDRWSDEFYNFVYACENRGDRKIIGAAMADENNNEVFNISAVPVTRRSFIVGGWPWQEESREVIDAQKSEVNECFVSSGLSKIYSKESMLTINRIKLEDPVVLRGIALLDGANKCPIFVVITNISIHEMSTQNIINCYLRKWPNLQQGHRDFLLANDPAVLIYPKETQENIAPNYMFAADQILTDSGNFWPNIEFLIASLDKYCRKHFFLAQYKQTDFSTIKNRIYSLGGFLRERPGVLEVEFLIPQGYPYVIDLAFAIRRINESDNHDFTGRQLVMKMSQAQA